jgi:hypothetical protein
MEYGRQISPSVQKYWQHILLRNNNFSSLFWKNNNNFSSLFWNNNNNFSAIQCINKITEAMVAYIQIKCGFYSMLQIYIIKVLQLGGWRAYPRHQQFLVI